jgi:hypothetical protein
MLKRYDAFTGTKLIIVHVWLLIFSVGYTASYHPSSAKVPEIILTTFDQPVTHATSSSCVEYYRTRLYMISYLAVATRTRKLVRIYTPPSRGVSRRRG